MHSLLFPTGRFGFAVRLLSLMEKLLIFFVVSLKLLSFVEISTGRWVEVRFLLFK